MLFVTNRLPIKVTSKEDKKLTYSAGVIAAGVFNKLQSIKAREMIAFSEGKWGILDTETGLFEKQDDYSLLEQSVYWENYWPVLAILTSDINRVVTVERALEWLVNDPDFFVRCYEAAYKQNPKTDPAYREETGLDVDGKPKAKEDIKKKG